ncbi:TRAP transporter small permease [Epibacterium ulvae]|uniref:TRAP transporter small permease n=1 Tax=Epibacterium ulvae TaxID=1156985 RepID=UPI001BFC0204|nr:TRAP transporter small permease [Epibacterium ulvae]MBT8153425.1 TRAP transporter small permease [Epibacterium ulvae]
MSITTFFYKLSGYLSAAFLAGIGVLILAQIIARLLGSQIPSADDFAAWSMAAAVFLALPQTFLSGGHIRVTLLFSSVPDGLRKLMDICATLVAIATLSWSTWYGAEYAYESYVYHDVSQGIIAVPLWIPQISMVVGLLLMTLALTERLISMLRGNDIMATSDEDFVGQE